MASAYQIAQVSCAGGLDLRSNTQELLRRPGFATKLRNYEQSISGGYRRINGYQEIGGGLVPVPGTGPILGVFVYNNGFVVCRGSDVYFTFDSTEWLQVNKDQSTLTDYTTFSAAVTLSRTSAGHYTFDEFTFGDGKVELIIRDPNNQMAILTIDGSTKATADFSYRLIPTVTKASYGEILKTQHVASGNPDAPTAVYVSNILDVDDFTTGSSQEITIAEPVTGLKVFRENLYIFCESSVWRASNLESPTDTVVQNVTRNVGCIDGYTIQEIGGDLMFLSNDGLRTLAGTDRIGDVNISTVSLNINNETLRIIQNRNDFSFRSVVLKDKSQYRMFYSEPSGSTVSQEGILATFYPNPETGQAWSFSRTRGIEVSAVAAGYVNNIQTAIHGDFSGKVYLHDTGNSFNGVEIPSLYETPFFDIGDSGLRKAFKEITTYVLPEGDVDLRTTIRYDFNSPDVHQPLRYQTAAASAPAFYGTAIYGAAANFRYGSPQLPIRTTQIAGSGMTISLSFETEGITDSFTIQGYDLHFTVSGRI